LRIDSPPASVHAPGGIGCAGCFFCIFMERLLRVPKSATPQELAALIGEFRWRLDDGWPMESLKARTAQQACGRLLARRPGAWR